MDIPLLRSLDEEDRRRVLSTAHRRRFTRREVLFHEGDPGETLHLVVKGRVAVRVTTALGDVATLAILGPGDVLGELALLAGPATRSATAVALEPAETLSLHRDQFTALRARHPAVDRFLVEALAAVVRRTTNELLEALYLPVEARICRRLLALVDLYGDGGPVAEVPLTQEDLATLAGTARPTVNRVLREAEDAGAVRLHRARIVVTDTAYLARHARS